MEPGSGSDSASVSGWGSRSTIAIPTMTAITSASTTPFGRASIAGTPSGTIRSNPVTGILRSGIRPTTTGAGTAPGASVSSDGRRPGMCGPTGGAHLSGLPSGRTTTPGGLAGADGATADGATAMTGGTGTIRPTAPTTTTSIRIRGSCAGAPSTDPAIRNTLHLRRSTSPTTGRSARSRGPCRDRSAQVAPSTAPTVTTSTVAGPA